MRQQEETDVEIQNQNKHSVNLVNKELNSGVIGNGCNQQESYDVS